MHHALTRSSCTKKRSVWIQTTKFLKNTHTARRVKNSLTMIVLKEYNHRATEKKKQSSLDTLRIIHVQELLGLTRVVHNHQLRSPFDPKRRVSACIAGLSIRLATKKGLGEMPSSHPNVPKPRPPTRHARSQ